MRGLRLGPDAAGAEISSSHARAEVRLPHRPATATYLSRWQVLRSSAARAFPPFGPSACAALSLPESPVCHRRVDDAQCVDTQDPQLGVDDRIRIVRPPHLAAAERMVNRDRGRANMRVDLSIGAAIRGPRHDLSCGE